MVYEYDVIKTSTGLFSVGPALYYKFCSVSQSQQEINKNANSMILRSLEASNDFFGHFRLKYRLVTLNYGQ